MHSLSWIDLSHLTWCSPSVVNCCPIEQIEEEKEKWKYDKKSEISNGICVLLSSKTVEFSKFHLEENSCIFHESSKHKHNAAYDPSFHGSQTLRLWKDGKFKIPPLPCVCVVGTCGEFVWIVLKILMRTKNIVIKSVIRPGITYQKRKCIFCNAYISSWMEQGLSNSPISK